MEAIITTLSNDVSRFKPNNDLSEEDKNYCNGVYESYSNHITHVQGLLHFVENKNSGFEELHKEKKQHFSLKKVGDAIECLNDTIESLTESFILRLENYFAKRYCLVFESIILKREKLTPDRFSSYDLIIKNITGQVGSDLLKAGKEQIKNRFLKCFHKDRLPILKGNKITIPDFISLDEHYGAKISLRDEYNSGLVRLINALNLFLHDSTELPERNTSQLIEWKTIIDLTEHYKVFSEVSFRFFKNRRIDVLFGDAVTARKFWNYYKLEIIEKIISKND